MQFGIGLPAWIVDEKNSILVLGVYTLIFMIGLPSAVYYWWSNSLKVWPLTKQFFSLIFVKSYRFAWRAN